MLRLDTAILELFIGIEIDFVFGGVVCNFIVHSIKVCGRKQRLLIAENEAAPDYKHIEGRHGVRLVEVFDGVIRYKFFFAFSMNFSFVISNRSF